MALACSAITAVSGGVSFWSFGVFILPLQEEFGWLRAEIAGAFSISWLVQGLLGPLVGRTVDRIGSKPVVVLGTLATGISFVLLTTTSTLWQFYLFHFLSAVCRTWMFYLPLNVLITKWFVRQRTLALAIFTSGFSVGGVLFVPLLTLIADSVGWRGGYWFCGAALYAVVLPLALGILRSTPSEMHLTPDGDPAPTGTSPAASDPRESSSHSPISTAIERPSLPVASIRHWTVSEALRTRAFWLIAGGLSVMFAVQLSFNVHAIALFVSRGLTTWTAAAVVVAFTAIIGLLRVPFGYFIDRTANARAIILLVTLTQGAAVLLLLLSTGPIALGVFVALWGITGGGLPLLESALIFRTFGDRHYGALLGTSGLVSTGGALLGPVFAGMVFDATGGYDAALLVFFTASLVAFGFFLAFRPPNLRQQGNPSA